MADERTNDKGTHVTKKEAATELESDRVVELPPPTQDQIAYLNAMKLDTLNFDPTMLIGGPSTIKKPTA